VKVRASEIKAGGVLVGADVRRIVDGKLAVAVNVSGTVSGELVGGKLNSVEGGLVNVQVDVKDVGAGALVIGFSAETVGGGSSSRRPRPTKAKSREPAKARPPARAPKQGKKQSAPPTNANVDVEQVAGGQVIGTQVNQRGSDTVHGNEVHVTSGRQATLSRGIGGENLQIGSVTIYQGTSAQPGAGVPEAHVVDAVEEKLRLDVALPKTAVVDEPFDLVIAVKQPDARVLSLADLDQVVSAEGSIFRSVERNVVKYRIAVTGVGFQVTPPSYLLELRVGTNSQPIAFQVISSKAGKRSLLVNAYQEDGALAAQTRLTIAVVVSVSE
jgi:hypothetical protein